MADKKTSVKSKVEAILFSVGHKLNLDEICKLSRSKKEEALAALKELQAEYEQKQSSIMLADEGDFWKFTVRDHLISVVRKIVTETELTKSVMETLAVIAFKYPMLQADIIKLRTNKAYEHLVELEKAGYITRQKHSRTNLIKLTDKFFKYFDLTEDKLKEQFRDFESIARAIKEKEAEVDNIKEGQRKRAEELKQQDEKIKQEIESLDNTDEEFDIPLGTYELNQEEAVQQNKESHELKEDIGGLEVVNTPKEPSKKEDKQQEKSGEIAEYKNKIGENQAQIEKNKPDVGDKSEEDSEKMQHYQKNPKIKSKGIQVTPEMEKRIDEKIQQMIHGEKE